MHLHPCEPLFYVAGMKMPVLASAISLSGRRAVARSPWTRRESSGVPPDGSCLADRMAVGLSGWLYACAVRGELLVARAPSDDSLDRVSIVAPVSRFCFRCRLQTLQFLLLLNIVISILLDAFQVT